MKITNRLAIFILILLIIFHGINNYIIIKNDTIPFQAEPAALYHDSIKTYFELKENFSLRKLVGVLEELTKGYEGTTLVLFSLPIYWIFGISEDIAMMVNTIFLCILIFSIYGIGKYIFSIRVGLMASIICSFFPLLYSSSRNYLSWFPLSAMVTLNIYLFLKSDILRKKTSTLLFAFSLLLSLLTHVTFSLYIIGPCIILFWIKKDNILHDRRSLRNIILSSILIITFLILFIFYFHINDMIQQRAGDFGFKIWPVGHISFLTLLLRYIKNINFHLSFLFYILPFALIFLLLSKNKYRFFLISWLVTPALLCCPIYLMKFQQHYYFIKHILPILPGYALVICYFLDNLHIFLKCSFVILKNRKFKTLIEKKVMILHTSIIILILLTSLFCYLSPSFKKMYFSDKITPEFFGRPLASQFEINISSIISIFENYSELHSTVGIFFFIDGSPLSWVIISRIIEKNFIENQGYFIISKCTFRDNMISIEWEDYQVCINKIQNSQFIIYQDIADTNYFKPTSSWSHLNAQLTTEKWDSIKNNGFRLVTQLNDTDDQEIQIWIKKE